MKSHCDACKKEVSEKEMLWVVYGDKDICRKCYDKQLKGGRAIIVMPLLCSVLDEENKWKERN